jgi:hypothetical protein
VQAVSTTARMPAAASKINRRRKEGAPVLIGVLQSCQARGAARTWKGSRRRGLPRRARVHVEPNRRGPWNSVTTTSTATATARLKYCGRQSTSGCYARACFAARTLGHLLPDGCMPHGAAKCPPAYTPNLTQPQGNPKRAAYPAQMLKLRITYEFPPAELAVAGEPLLERPGHTARPCRTDQQRAATPNERPTSDTAATLAAF